jgi:preprotein translocase subunit SecF
MNYAIIQKKKIWLSFSLVLFIVASLALAVWKVELGIDFTGGSLLEVNYSAERPEIKIVEEKLADLDLGSLHIQPLDASGLVLRFQDSSKAKHDEVMKRLGDLAQDKKVEEVRYDSVGPSIGAELKKKSTTAMTWVFIAIVLYISIAFQKISKPVASWKYGVAALIAMAHDVVITVGVFAFLGHFYGVEVNTPFVAAVLTVLGYSVHDTIVVFDRIRENLVKVDDSFENVVNISLNQTMGRSLNTSLTVILTLVSIMIFGGSSISMFALALTVGIAMGTYSSIFVASPLLVAWEEYRLKKLNR